MQLNERIALARKQAGLSQGQLGEKLGISDQALDGWESGRTVPDVASLTQLCRVLDVSSDWLLLGEEGAQTAAPPKCPGCQSFVADADKFCPNCGRSLTGGGCTGYTLVLQPNKFPGAVADKLLRLARSCDWVRQGSPLWNISARDAADLAKSAPVILGRGLTPLQARQAADVFDAPYQDVKIYRDPESLDLDELERRQPPVPLHDLPQELRQPMSFGTVVGAVIVGILIAVVILSFL